MDFARKQLEKYGWKDGDGLGREGQGMAIAIKPNLKMGKEGMGYDLCKDLTGDTWWTKVYSDCLSRISVPIPTEDDDQDDHDQEKLGKKGKKKRKKDKEEESNSIKTNSSNKYMNPPEEEERPMEKMRRRMMKANFTSFSKGATLLTNGELVPEHNPEKEPESSSPAVKILSDEELLKACGGRTAHKAARFGLKLNGKLARIAAQDERIASSSSSPLTLDNSSNEIDESSSTGKDKKKRKNQTSEEIPCHDKKLSKKKMKQIES